MHETEHCRFVLFQCQTTGGALNKLVKKTKYLLLFDNGLGNEPLQMKVIKRHRKDQVLWMTEVKMPECPDNDNLDRELRNLGRSKIY